MNPLVSVIIPTFNPSGYIFEAVESVKNQQNFNNDSLEIIVVDDCSNNEASLQILRELNRVDNVKVVSLARNGGPSLARNTGIKKAKGQYIGFIDDDDLWPPNKLKIQFEAFDEHEHLEIVSGQVQYFLDGDVKDPIKKYHKEGKILYHVHLGACIIRSSLFHQSKNYFDENLRLSEDWDWWLRIKENGIKHLILDAPTLKYRVHENNSSTQLNIKELGLLKVLKASLDRRTASNTCEILAPHLGEMRSYQVSVVLPLYNGVQYIRRALDSVMSQTYPIEKVIVVDDGSQDNSVDIVEKYYPEVQILRQMNKGVASARNAGWKACTTPWIAFIDQDDEWLQKKIALQIEKAKENSQTDWVGCYQRFQSVGGELPTCVNSNFQQDHLSQIPSAWLIRKSILESLNGFNEKYRYGSDLDLLRRYRALNLTEQNSTETLLIKHFTGENETMSVKESVKDMLSIIHEQIKSKG